jgi:hypothetical protein
MAEEREDSQANELKVWQDALRATNTAATAAAKSDRSVVGQLRAAASYDELCSSDSPVRDEALSRRARYLWNAAEEAVKAKWPQDVVTALRTKCRDDLVAATELADDASSLLITVHDQLGENEAAEKIRHARRTRLAESLPYLTAEQKKALVESRPGRVGLTGVF